jgi:hypothetical protein
MIEIGGPTILVSYPSTVNNAGEGHPRAPTSTRDCTARNDHIVHIGSSVQVEYNRTVPNDLPSVDTRSCCWRQVRSISQR